MIKWKKPNVIPEQGRKIVTKLADGRVFSGEFEEKTFHIDHVDYIDLLGPMLRRDHKWCYADEL